MSYQSEIMSDSPKGYWFCGDAGPNLVDSSGNGFTMTPQGTPTYQKPSLVPSAPDGSWQNNVNANFIATHQAAMNVGDIVTVEAWLKRNQANDAIFQAILSKQNGTFYLRLNSSHRLEFLKAFVSSIVVSTTTITDTNIHYVAATKNGSNVHLYIDGVDVTGTVTNATLTDTANSLVLGATDSAGEKCNMFLDEVAYYGTALSASRIAAHYQLGQAALAQIANRGMVR